MTQDQASNIADDGTRWITDPAADDVPSAGAPAGDRGAGRGSKQGHVGHEGSQYS